MFPKCHGGHFQNEQKYHSLAVVCSTVFNHGEIDTSKRYDYYSKALGKQWIIVQTSRRLREKFRKNNISTVLANPGVEKYFEI